MRLATVLIVICFLMGLPPAMASYPQTLIAASGAHCDATTDDHAVIQTTLNNAALGTTFILDDNVICYLGTTGITVPVGISIVGFGSPLSGNNGSWFKCSNTVAACVTLSSSGGTSIQGGQSLQHLGIYSSGYGHGGSSIGLKVDETYDALIDDVEVEEFDYNYAFVATNTLGITARVTNSESMKADQADVMVDSFPEVRFNHMRFGSNADQSGSAPNRAIALLYIKGSATGGPNTISVQNSQFNPGGVSYKCAIKFANAGTTQASGPQWLIYQFTGNYIESNNSGDSAFCTDSTITSGTARLVVANNIFVDNTSANSVMNLNSNTQIFDWVWTGNIFNNWADWSYAGPQIGKLVMTGNDFNGPTLSIHPSGTNSELTLGGNQYTNLSIVGNFYDVSIDGNAHGTCTMTLSGPANRVGSVSKGNGGTC